MDVTREWPQSLNEILRQVYEIYDFETHWSIINLTVAFMIIQILLTYSAQKMHSDWYDMSVTFYHSDIKFFRPHFLCIYKMSTIKYVN